MIYKLESGNYVISSGSTWLPGSYESERTARLAFKLSDETLQRLQDTANSAHPDPNDRTLTYGMVLEALRSERQAGTNPAPSFKQREIIFEDGCFIAYDPDNQKAVRLSDLNPKNIEVRGNKYEN